jgi:hypothetical protein
MLRTTIVAWGSGMGGPCRREPNGVWRGHTGVTWRIRGTRLRGFGIHGIQDSLGVQYGTKVYISRVISMVDRSFVLNSNSISYILVTAQYFRTSLGDLPWTYLGSLPKTPQTPNVLKLASITTDYERYKEVIITPLVLPFLDKRIYRANIYNFA